MATVSVERQIQMDVPGHYQDIETYPELSDADGFLNFLNGETCSLAPTRGDLPSSAYYNKNIRVMFNEGQVTPDGYPKHMRTLFTKNATIRESVNGGKREDDPTIIPLNQYTTDQCKPYCNYVYYAKNGFGMICGESGENEGPWKLQSQYAGRQMKDLYQGITDFANANPDKKIINGGMTYASHSTIWPGKCDKSDCSGVKADYNTLKNAFSTPQAARDLLQKYEWEFNRYWGDKLYETGALPLTNAYSVHPENDIMFWKTILQVELAAKGLEGIFANPRSQSIFFWARALELQKYTEGYIVDLGNGVKMLISQWPPAHPGLVYALARMGFRHTQHVFGWDDPYGYGKNPNILCEPGNRISYSDGNTGGRQLVSQYVAVPNTNNFPVGYATASFGWNDLIPVAGKMHCKQTAFLNKRPDYVSWSINGQNGPAVDAGYIPYCIDNHKPLIRAAKDGNRAIVDIFDPYGWGGVVNVNLGGNFGTVPLEVWPNVDNQFHLQY